MQITSQQKHLLKTVNPDEYKHYVKSSITCEYTGTIHHLQKSSAGLGHHKF